MPRRIALVEDDAAIRANYADALRKHGHDVQAYYFENDVDNDSDTETFVAVKAEIDKGLDGQPNAAAVHVYFDSMESLGAAMQTPKMGEIMADVANYTNIAPVMQISEVVS